MHAAIESPSHALIVLAGVQRTLAESTDLQRIKDVRDQAEAIRYYIKAAAFGLEMQNQAAEVKLKAERRAGELLARLRLRGGDRKSSKRNKPVRLAELGIFRTESGRWQREALLPEDEFQEFLRQTKEQGKELTSSGLLRLVRMLNRPETHAGSCGELFSQLNGRLRQLARQRQRFACIYVDPPWPSGRKAIVRTSDFVQALSELSVSSLAADQAHLHLWVTPDLLEHGIRLLRAWGFRYRTSLAKTKIPTSYGRFWQPAHDVLLLGVRGELEFRDYSFASWMDRQGASTNCAVRSMQDLIERVSHPPYLDLFGREPAAAWTAVMAST